MSGKKCRPSWFQVHKINGWVVRYPSSPSFQLSPKSMVAPPKSTTVGGLYCLNPIFFHDCVPALEQLGATTGTHLPGGGSSSTRFIHVLALHCSFQIEPTACGNASAAAAMMASAPSLSHSHGRYLEGIRNPKDMVLSYALKLALHC
jgi:hypothetical protein